ncbi:MAG: immune inhibitor A, partial [Chloroflexi bacterium]|nr:immune inhibitor A [Chloroflexota bacterium]
YLAQRYGGTGSLRYLVGEPQDNIQGIDAYLAQLGYSERFEDVLKRWVVANYLGSAAPEGYGYDKSPGEALPTQFLRGKGQLELDTAQFGSEYIHITADKGNALLRFQGRRDVPLLPVRAYSGSSCWWSNRGDSIDTRLTRPVDLRAVGQATLGFRAWFEIEKEWDYAYVEVSTDGGKTWSILQGSHTSPQNPVGNSFGHGFTGSSNGWVSERMDLTPYAGQQVLLRFEYVTDDALNTSGLCIDDIAVPEVGFFDDAESDSGWHAEGFARTDGALPQRFIVQVIEVPTEGKPTVRELALDESNSGDLVLEGFGTRLKNAVAIVTPIAQLTRQPAHYTLSLSPPP